MCVCVCAWCAQNCCCPQLLHRLRPVRIDLTLLGLSTKLFVRLVFFLPVRGCLSGFTGVSVVSVRRAAHSATVFFAHGSRGSGTTTAVSFFAAQKQRESILCCERCVCLCACVCWCVGVHVCAHYIIDMFTFQPFCGQPSKRTTRKRPKVCMRSAACWPLARPFAT